MQVLWHEIRSRRKHLVIWTVGVSVYMLASFGKYNAIAGDTQAIVPLLNAFPKTIQAVFGMSGLDMTTITGYYGVVYLYLLLLLAIHAGMAGADVVIDDERDHTSEFIYTRPISRLNLLTQKFLAGLVVVSIIWAVAAVSSYLAMAYFARPETFSRELWVFLCGAALVQWVCYALGVMAAGLRGSARFAMRIIAAFVFVSYLLYTYAKFTGDTPWASYVSIFSWFDAAELLRTMQLPLGATMSSLIGGLIAVGLGYVAYLRRDISA